MTNTAATVDHARLAEARQARGWTPEQLGDASGIDEETIRRAEETGDGLTPSDVGVIADVCGVRRRWLLGRDSVVDRVRRAAGVQS